MVDKKDITDTKRLYLIQIKSNEITEKDYKKLNKKDKRKLMKKSKKYYLKPEYRRELKVVLTGGVFDILHYGHIYTLEKVKEKGDILIAVIATDETVKKAKGRKPIHSQKHRQRIVQALKHVDLAIIGEKDPRKMIKRINPDLIVYGYDQKPFITDYPYIKLKKGIKERKYKTSVIIEKLGI